MCSSDLGKEITFYGSVPPEWVKAAGPEAVQLWEAASEKIGKKLMGRFPTSALKGTTFAETVGMLNKAYLEKAMLIEPCAVKASTPLPPRVTTTSFAPSFSHFFAAAAALGVTFLSLALAVYRRRDGQTGERALKRLFAFSVLWLFLIFAAILVERLLGLPAIAPVLA